MHGHTYIAGLTVLLAIEEEFPVFVLIKEIFIIDHSKYLCEKASYTVVFGEEECLSCTFEW